MEMIDGSTICFCRLCGTDGFLVEIFSETNGGLVTKIKNCLNLQISDNDDLPKEICTDCENKVDLFYNFKMQCHFTEKKFRGEIDIIDYEEENELDSFVDESIDFYRNDLPDEKNLYEPLKFDQSQLNSAPSNKNSKSKFNILEKESVIFEEKPIDIVGVVNENIGEVVKQEKVTKDNNSVTELEEIIKSVNEISNSNEYQLRFKDNNYPCRYCYRSFKETRFLENHINTMHKNDIVKCDLCNKFFNYANNLERHKREVHLNLKPFGCDICGTNFSTKCGLNEHKLTHAELKYECSACHRKFASTKRLMKHQNVHLFTVEERKQLYKKTVIKKKPSSTPSPFTMLTNYSCRKCNKTFLSYKTYRSHFRFHSNVRYTCEICGKVFLMKKSFEVHQDMHANLKRHKCKICDKRFRQISHLSMHLKTHSDERPFKCSYCEKSFKIAIALRLHTKIHTGDKPFACHICPKKYIERRGLKKHLLTHHGEFEGIPVIN